MRAFVNENRPRIYAQVRRCNNVKVLKQIGILLEDASIETQETRK